jgi:hypothetical protein
LQRRRTNLFVRCWWFEVVQHLYVSTHNIYSSPPTGPGISKLIRCFQLFR